MTASLPKPITNFGYNIESTSWCFQSNSLRKQMSKLKLDDKGLREITNVAISRDRLQLA